VSKIKIEETNIWLQRKRIKTRSHVRAAAALLVSVRNERFITARKI